jgi:hypothetical protein
MISGLAMILIGILLWYGFQSGRGWFGPRVDRADKISRSSGIVFAILLILAGGWFLNLARRGFVLEKGGLIVHDT